MVSLRSSLSVAFIGSILASVACGSSTSYTAQVYVKASIGPTDSAPTSCMLAPGTDWLDIGTTTGEIYNPVPNGSSFEGTNVSVDCRVTPNGGGFDVDITTSRSGETTGGTLSISGHFTSTGTQTGITATFGKSTGVFTANDCTVTYANMYEGVDAGRVWGELDCGDATYASQMRTCDATSEFRFENCGE